MGDPAGVGPELCLRALRDRRLSARCVPVVFGDAAVLARTAGACGLPFTARCVTLAEWRRAPRAAAATVVDCRAVDAAAVRPGVIQPHCGRAALSYIEQAVAAARAGRIAAVATAPVHKEALRLAGCPHPGHTELLAALTGARRTCMTMASGGMIVSLVTAHVAYADVPRLLTRKRIVAVIELTAEALRRLGRARPRLAVCALNPHAGEGGLFGREEREVIRPAVAAAAAGGLIVAGPLPPDTAFLPRRRATVDAYVAMYHDQGLTPFKMLAFETGVNLTLGLPIVRTSVDHGTAFDIAWQGKASAESLVHSVLWAVRLAARP